MQVLAQILNTAEVLAAQQQCKITLLHLLQVLTQAHRTTPLSSAQQPSYGICDEPCIQGNLPHTRALRPPIRSR